MKPAQIYKHIIKYTNCFVNYLIFKETYNMLCPVLSDSTNMALMKTQIKIIYPAAEFIQLYSVQIAEWVGIKMM